MDFDYDATVQYPFGHGLSYTTFTQEITNFKADGDNVTFDVVVTNTGSTAGKDVVEVYFTPPYNNGGIEKAAVNLIQFGKTDELAPGASQTVSFTIPKEDMASCDSSCIQAANGGCILEAGEYRISVRADAYTVCSDLREPAAGFAAGFRACECGAGHGAGTWEIVPAGLNCRRKLKGWPGGRDQPGGLDWAECKTTCRKDRKGRKRPSVLALGTLLVCEEQCRQG